MEHLQVSAAQWRQIFPRAPQEVIAAFASKESPLIKCGALQTRTRLAYFCANIEHECGGFTIPNLTENINYTAERMAQVWPNRFSSAAAVRGKYGTGPGWQLRAFNDIYGNRMGNRPGTADGSTFIGRGGPQWTGRDGYTNLRAITGVDAVNTPALASKLSMQPEVCAAFWQWKNLNRFADRNDFLGCVKAWNGGTNGLADRKAMMAGNNPVISRLVLTADAADVINTIDSPSIVPVDMKPTGMFWIQDSLNRLGAQPPLVVDGRTGPATKAALKAFQARHGLDPDGKVGPATLTVMDRELAKLDHPEIVVPEIILPAPDAPARPNLAPTFWGRFLDLFRPDEEPAHV